MTTTTTDILDLTTATPAEIDEQLFPLWAQRWHLTDRIYSYRRVLAKTIWPAEFKETYEKYTGPYSSKVHAIRNPEMAWGQRQVADTLAYLDKDEAMLDEVATQIAPIDAEFERRGGWSRYILVRGGHLHRRGCSTIRPTTACFLLSESSGLNEDEVVERYSYTACTKCFPDAPVATAPSPVAQGYCEGSGTTNVDDVNGSKRLYRAWGRCQECGGSVSVTSLGKARKHKPAKKES